MKLSDDIEDVIDHIIEPKQILKLTKCSWDERVDLEVPQLEIAPGSKNPSIANMFKQRPTYDKRSRKLVINKISIRDNMRSSVVDNVVRDIQTFLEMMNIGPRTKFSKWFKTSKHNILYDHDAIEDLYQVWKYMKANNPGLKSVHDKNVVGLLGSIMNKYKDVL